MNSIQNIFDHFVYFFITPDLKKHRLVNKIWLGLIFIGGIAAWCVFLNCPKNNCNYHDWLDIVAPRLNFLKDAATIGALPLHASTPMKLGVFYTERYLAIPDAFFSPQFLLLRFLDVHQFIYFEIFLFFAIGFWGLLWFRKKFNLSNLSFTFVFVLFNLNGHILAHISVGHFTWVAYYLFPWFAMLIFKLLDGQSNWQWVLAMTSLLFITLLQGGYHHFVWMLFFLGFLAIFMPRHFFTILKAAVFSVFLGMLRFLPLLSLYDSLNENKFIGGYPDIQSILSSMINISQGGTETPINNLTLPIGAWETTLFTGVIGAAFIIYFGLIYPISHQNPENKYRVLILPTLGLLMLSFDLVFHFIFKAIPLPLFTGERVVTRMISLVFVFILIQAGIEFQHWLNNNEISKVSILSIMALAVIATNDLVRNMREWVLLVASHNFPGEEKITPQWFVTNNYSDEPYITLILTGFIIMLVSYSILIALSIRERKKKRQSEGTIIDPDNLKAQPRIN
jgi:hypothetical protein